MGNHVGDQGVDSLPVALAQDIGDFPGNIGFGEDSGADGVVDVVVDVGDAVGDADDLPLQRLGNAQAGVSQDGHAHLMGEV